MNLGPIRLRLPPARILLVCVIRIQTSLLLKSQKSHG